MRKFGPSESPEGPLSEWIAGVLAHAVELPHLAVVPRKKYGRPRKDLPPPVPA
jgi:hypothetical protein